MLHAVIMAGGAGTRFWPESRRLRPKQLLPLAGGESLLRATRDRLQHVVGAQHTWVMTAAALVEQVRRELPDVPPEMVVGEPCRRDTAPCIGLAAHLIAQRDRQATMAVLPADHVIQPHDAFQRAVELAAHLVESGRGRIVTFGIRPTYPAESFGYIQRGEPLPPQPPWEDLRAFRVQRFREKPKADVARQFLESGTFYWNAGIFVWKVQTILDALALHAPQMGPHLEAIVRAYGRPDFDAVFAKHFAAIQPISIDYAVMEHAPDVLVVEAPFAWDDVGSWQAVARLRGADAQGNTVLGRHLGIDTHNCVVRGQAEHLIVTLGVHDLLIVQTPDATLVADRRHEEAVREVVRRIEEAGWEQYL
jgi:mannose-1-phosphate guanylyltransferase